MAFLRAARAGNLEKVRNFLNEEGDIHTCNAVSNNNLVEKYKSWIQSTSRVVHIENYAHSKEHIL